jgi:hypothetical protein
MVQRLSEIPWIPWHPVLSPLTSATSTGLDSSVNLVSMDAVLYTEWLKMTEMYSFMTVEMRCPELRCWQGLSVSAALQQHSFLPLKLVEDTSTAWLAATSLQTALTPAITQPSPCDSVSKLSCSKDTSRWSGATPVHCDLILIWLYLQRPVSWESRNM